MNKGLVDIKQTLIEQKIFLIRGQKIMLDKDLAELYSVKSIRLREQVKRNLERFPSDFMFQLNESEARMMVSQNAIPSKKHLGGHLPYAFTEHGILMLSSVLNSKNAIQINIQIMRTFTKLRELMVAHKDLRKKIEAIERKYDCQFQEVFTAIRKILYPPRPPKPKIPFGFQPPRIKQS